VETTIVWLRDDLRLADNPALNAAVARGGRVCILYILDEQSPGIRPLGSASKWWLHHSLATLSEAALNAGSRLTLRHGAAAEVLEELIDESNASAVYWNRRYSAAREIDASIKSRLRDRDLDVQSFAANLLFEPWTIQTAQGTPFQVFTPFWRACLTRPIRAPLDPPDAITGVSLHSDRLSDLNLLPHHPDWAGGLRETWTPGEKGAHDRLESFARDVLANYGQRDHPAETATSMLSPHLRFGEISPYQVWDRIHGALGAPARRAAPAFLRELGWREFNWNLLFHFPTLASENYHDEFNNFPWRKPTARELHAWHHGTTGIPLVDAGMRELWHSGYMHNRVRMVAASFLVKNLLVDWRLGEQWFWDTLVDADEASNPANWQWVAGSGADSAPYFRIFNPTLQADKFDKAREYIDRWVPPDRQLTDPIVDITMSRARALDAYDRMRRHAPAE
jgi:deoxyribodipyrimidine photo-lyase